MWAQLCCVGEGVLLAKAQSSVRSLWPQWVRGLLIGFPVWAALKGSHSGGWGPVETALAGI